MSPEEFFEYFAENDFVEFSNLQCRFLGKTSRFADAKEVIETGLIDFVVDLGQHQQLVDTLCDRLDWKLPDQQIRANASPKVLTRESLRPSLLEFIIDANKEDLRLVEFVKEYGGATQYLDKS